MNSHHDRHFLTPHKSRIAVICALAILLGIAASVIARLLLWTLALMTNLFYFQKFSFGEARPMDNRLGLLAIAVPVVGGIIVGFMARYGNSKIRGHGIPEAMENILLQQSKIPPNLIILKPLSAAIAIGSGGPFGAEGPIIATGGAVGSWAGQLIHVTSYERKILLAAGAAAGMTAIFGTPLAAVLLATELLLFEFRHKSLVPIALAAATAATVRFALMGGAPFIPMTDVTVPSGSALTFYLVLGLVFGILSPVVTAAIYWIEDTFEKIPVHWMWYPALGGIAVGLIGVIRPETLGVGYGNITSALNGDFGTAFVISLVFWKLISWAIALGSGTSGGTLAPLMTLGAGLGLVSGRVGDKLLPSAHVDVHVASLIGMSAIFAGCSHALLASVVFAIEVTRQPMGLVPVLGACSVTYLIATLLSPHSIMTEKLVRRGHHVPNEYFAEVPAVVSARATEKAHHESLL